MGSLPGRGLESQQAAGGPALLDPRAEGGPGTPHLGPLKRCLGENTFLFPLPPPKHAGGWTGPAGLECQIAGMQAGTHPKGALAAGGSLKSLGPNRLSLLISSEHEAELGTEGTRCVAALAAAQVSCPPARDVP